MAGNSSYKTASVPNKKMQNHKSKLKPIVRLKGFTLLELLIVMAIIVLLMGILLPCLNRAKESAYELAAIQTEVDEEGKVRLEITDPSHRKAHDDIYMIKIERPYRCRVVLKKPHPSGMKLVKRDGQEYIKWRPQWDHIGVHLITVVFEGQETSEQQIRIYVFNKELLEAERKDKLNPD
jgi:prepilin-type N-terminal cleavage/methylation domain-containing protein